MVKVVKMAKSGTINGKFASVKAKAQQMYKQAKELARTKVNNVKQAYNLGYKHGYNAYNDSFNRSEIVSYSSGTANGMLFRRKENKVKKRINK